MASDTTLTPAINDRVERAEAADVLARLSPDEIHPARLAGPHAWHPWGLTAAPPTDRHLRLMLPTGTCNGATVQLLDRLEAQLGRAPWPPDRPLDLRRQGNRLHCRDHHARHALIEIEIASGMPATEHAEVVTRDGWPILDELATLNDRIRSIDTDAPTRNDLADLTGWVERKMADPVRSGGLVTSLPQLLTNQAREHPATADRIRTILANRDTPSAQHQQVLDYLAEQLARCQPRAHGQQRQPPR